MASGVPDTLSIFSELTKVKFEILPPLKAATKSKDAVVKKCVA